VRKGTYPRVERDIIIMAMSITHLEKPALLAAPDALVDGPIGLLAQYFTDLLDAGMGA